MMKRIGIGVALAALLLAPVAMAAKSADGDKDGKKPRMTAEQKEKMKAMRQEHGKAMKPLHKKLEIATSELRILLAKDASDSDLKSKMNEIKKARNAIRDLKEKQMEEMASMFPVREQAERMARMGRGPGRGEGRGWRRGRGQGMGRGPDGKGCPMKGKKRPMGD